MSNQAFSRATREDLGFYESEERWVEVLQMEEQLQTERYFYEVILNPEAKVDLFGNPIESPESNSNVENKNDTAR